MNVISRLFIMMDQVRLQMHRPVGEIFDYCSGFNGLKMMAEAIQRGRVKGIASLLIPPDGVHSILTTPSGKCVSDFNIDEKVQQTKRPGRYLLLIQYEVFLWTGSYLLIEIDEEGTDARLFLNYRSHSKPTLLTELDLSLVESEHQLLSRVFRIAVGELEEMNQAIVHSGKVLTNAG